MGYTLDEIVNDITGETPASFEPTIDYVVTKVPRWAFEKFPGIPEVLGTRMQSVGEAMAIGRCFPESLQKALRSLETGRAGLNCDPAEKLYEDMSDDELVAKASVATPDRPFHLEAALRRGVPVERLNESSGVDPWFLDQIARICDERARLGALGSPAALSRRDWRRAKRPVSPMPSWHTCGGRPRAKYELAGSHMGCGRRSRRWTRARPNLPPALRTITRPTRTPTR